MSTTAIRAALRTVAEKRAERDAATDALNLKRAAFVEENRALLAHETELATQVAESEANARALLVVHFNATGEKKPVTGGEVKVGTVYSYDQVQALAWAKEKQMCLVPESLDERAFLAIAKVTQLPFVTTREEPRAQLATQLNAALLVEPEQSPAGAVA